MTANQLVALNLKRARKDAELTQEQAGQRLADYLGKPWSKASFSVAEKSVRDGARTREFNANELLAFTQVFGKTLAYFFEPPRNGKVEIRCGDEGKVISAASLQRTSLGGGLKGAHRQRQLRRIEEAARTQLEAAEQLKYLDGED